MIILKFGGSSIKDSSHIKNVYSIIHSKVKNDNIAIVFSAMGGTTNKLIKLAEKANNGEDYDFDLNNLKNIHLNCINDLQLIGTSVKLDKCFKNLKIDQNQSKIINNSIKKLCFCIFSKTNNNNI